MYSVQAIPTCCIDVTASTVASLEEKQQRAPSKDSLSLAVLSYLLALHDVF